MRYFTDGESGTPGNDCGKTKKGKFHMHAGTEGLQWGFLREVGGQVCRQKKLNGRIPEKDRTSMGNETISFCAEKKKGWA